MNNLKTLLAQPESADADSPGKSVFRQYWDKIERAEKAFASAERKRGRIVQRFNDEILSLEQAFCDANYQLTKKLVDFLEAKSLSKTDKSEVIDWANDQLETFMNSPFRGALDAQALIQKLHQHGTAFEDKPTEEELDCLREELRDMFANEDVPMGEADIEDLLNASREGSAAFFEEIEKKTKDVNDRLYEELEGEFDFSKPTDSKADDLSSQSLTKLYKRLVQRLHPDRAKNEEDRERRHQVMLQLTEAKREDDVFAMLRLVREHGDEDDGIFSDQQLHQLVDSLQNKLYEIREKKRELKTEQSIDALIYSKFHSKSNREMDRKFESYKKLLEDKIDSVSQVFESTTSIKQLKQQLVDRRQSSRFTYLDFEELFL